MRVVLGIVLLLVCVMIGYRYSGRFSERKKEFEFLKKFNSRIKREVAFSKVSLVHLVKNIDSRCAVADYLKKYFIDRTDNIEEVKVLNNDEKEFLSDYVKKLGQGDSASQKEFLTEAGVTIDGYLACCVEKEKQYGPLCLKLGLLFGLIILIILL